jgi:hypothetical protein
VRRDAIIPIMIDPAAPMASVFLWLLALVFTLGFALPLLVAPLAWARMFQWRVVAADELTIYLGRSLGAVALAIMICVVRAAPHASGAPALFDLIILAGILLALVHVWGALRRTQPWTETAEIGLYVAAAIAAWQLHP